MWVRILCLIVVPWILVTAISDLSHLVPLLGGCWTEVALISEDNSHPAFEFVHQFSFPLLLTSSARKILPLYTNVEEVRRLQLKLKCVILVLIQSGQDWKVTTVFSSASNIWKRYNRVQNSELDAPFGLHNSFVLGVFEEELQTSQGQQLLRLFQIDCRCMTILLKSKEGRISGMAVGKLIHKEKRGDKTIHIGSESILLNSTTVHNLNLDLISSMQQHFVNNTLKWYAYTRADFANHGGDCVSTSPNPYILLQSTDVKFHDEYYVGLLVDFLSHGKYGVSFLEFSQAAMAQGSKERKIDCKSNDKFSKEYAENEIVMRDVDFDKFYANLHARETTTGIILLTSTHSDGFNFVTCDGRYQESAYSIYLRTMEPRVWLALLTSLATVTTLGFLFIRNIGLRDSPWLLIYGILLEASSFVSKQLAARRQYSLIIIPILLASIILSNGNKGILTADLTAALPWKGLETFEEVATHNFSILSDVDIPLMLILFNLCPYLDNSTPLPPEALMDNSIFIQALNKSINLHPTPRLVDFRKQMLSRVKILEMEDNCTLESMHRYIRGEAPHQNDMIQQELLKCKETVYAIPSSEIYIRIAFDSPKIYHGKADAMFRFGNQYYALILGEVELNSMFIRSNLEGLESGGFIFYWESLMQWQSIRIYAARELKFQSDMARPTAMVLTRKCATIFMILIVALIGCILFFCSELIGNAIRTCFTTTSVQLLT